VALRQSYTRVGKFALIQHQRYAHAKQFKRANRMGVFSCRSFNG
jgi:IS5 family transposase